MGKLVFLDLVDRSGRIQLICPVERTGELDLHLGDIVGVTGSPAKSRRGEPSLQVDEVEVLAPIRESLPDTFHGLTDIEQRYRKRYLDLLMNDEVRDDFVLRAKIVTRSAPISTARASSRSRRRSSSRATAARSRSRSSRTHNVLDQDLYLRIATELYLKRLIVGGLEKVYEIGKDFRNEGVNYKRNPEFTMLEWYEAYADYEDTMRRMESLIEHVALATLGTTKVTFKEHEVDLKAPWKRVRLVDELKELDLWTPDYDDLKKRLEERNVDVSQDKTWSQLVDKAVTRVHRAAPRSSRRSSTTTRSSSRRSRARPTTTRRSSSGSSSTSAGWSSATRSPSSTTPRSRRPGSRCRRRRGRRKCRG